jgi:hypothetical protein
MARLFWQPAGLFAQLAYPGLQYPVQEPLLQAGVPFT